jgi:3-isopropylmalate/(R)-2-methylmalate dehydratase large subunit
MKGRRYAPQGRDWDEAVAHWRSLPSDPGATYGTVIEINALDLAPFVTWGTSPGMVVPITARVPELPANGSDRANALRMLEYMDLRPGTPIEQIKVDRVFIGSCTNSRIEDLRAAARIAKGYRVASGVRAMVVPGSQQIKQVAEQEGLNHIFEEAGLEGIGLLDVLGDESRHSESRRALRFNQQPKFRRPSGTRRAHPFGESHDGRGGRGNRAFH